ncbi:MAG: phytanoyl-CoA dioxygenase [Flavobacteriales bacterium]|nr:MAG: phytanoyl-CoA dioxygenase [Flavobacteriales bacterium]
MNFLLKYWGTLRRLRIAHYLNNLKHFNKLKNNRKLYQKSGIKKSVISSISHEDFQGKTDNNSRPWLDKIKAKDKIIQNIDFQYFNSEIKNQFLNWIDNGHMILKEFFPEEIIDQINSDVDEIIREEKLPFDYTNTRVMNCHKHSKTIKKTVRNEQLISLLNFVMSKKVKPFQTINFMRGSQVKAHSDSIHMTTEPLGYLIAIWVALEDIHPDSGPVFYHPASHKLPYVMNNDFETGNTAFAVGDNYYENYTDYIEKIVAEKQLPKEEFVAKKGDVLVWHANLLHGGSPVKNKALTRKSLVVHYFCEDVICYHEITQRPAIIEEI